MKWSRSWRGSGCRPAARRFSEQELEKIAMLLEETDELNEPVE
jgi:hypothetical protein